MREKKTTAVLLWVHYERASHFQFWSWVSEVYEKSAWATHVSSLRPDIQSALTNVRPTKLDTNARDIRGPTDRWVLKGYLWADYERIMKDYERIMKVGRRVVSGFSFPGVCVCTASCGNWNTSESKHTRTHTHARTNSQHYPRPYELIRENYEKIKRNGGRNGCRPS